MDLKPHGKVDELLDFLGYVKIDEDASEFSGNKLSRLVQGGR